MDANEDDIIDPRTARKFEQWLERNHEKKSEVWVRMFKKGTPEAGLTWTDAVDVAICFGWIDGQGKSYDDASRIQRFTPRRARSNWSKVNTERVARLTAEGRMRPAGLREVEAAKADGRWDRAYDSPSNAQVPGDFLAALKKNKKAYAFFKTLDKRNTYPITYRLQTAKKPETRARRIETIIAMFERGEKFHD